MGKIFIYLTRHGKTLFNVEERGQGWCDSPLMPEGEAVARALGRGLQKAGIRFDAAWSGDLLRQRRTARLVLDAMGQVDLPVQETPDLREVCFGSFEGERQSIRDALLLEGTEFTDIMDLYQAGFHRFTELVRALDTSGLAERAADVQDRMGQALTRMCRAAEAAGQHTLLAVSSGMSINCLLACYSDIRMALPNASVCRLCWEDGNVTIQSVGETCYVTAGMEA